MRQKILNALKTEYATLGLGEKAFNGVASFLEKTIKDENDIVTVIKGDDVRDILKSIQGETDTLRSAKAQAEAELKKLRGAQNPNPNPTPDPTQTPKEGESESEKMLKTLLAKVSDLEAKNAASEKKARETILMAGVRKNLLDSNRGNQALLDIILKGAEIGADDTEESLTKRYSDSYDDTYKSLFGNGVMPPAGGLFGGMPQADDAHEFDGAVSRLRKEGVLRKEPK